MYEFLNKLVNNYSKFFKETYEKEKYPNQDIHSCTALYDLCVSLNPDFVIDIGTNFGASTLSLSFALKTLGKPLSLLTTIDKSQRHWKEETPEIQQELLEKEGLDLKQIKTIESDFISLDAAQFVRKDVKIFVFYDIHDNNSETYSDKFLLNWVPLLGEAVVTVHDCSHVSESYVLRTDYKGYTMTKLRHFSGKLFAGFGECKRFIEWANEKEKDVFNVPKTSLIYFKFKED